ncbi:MAG: transposase [bacterium]|nr:MAG: transposase [bacterium]
MFVRVKSTPKSPRRSVQIVQSFRIGSKVRQRIVKHIGIARDDNELEELKSLAYSIKVKLELSGALPLYTPGEIEKLSKTAGDNANSSKRTDKLSSNNNKEKDNKSGSENIALPIDRTLYSVNLLDIDEEDRIIKGIHEIYGKLYDELGFDRVMPNPARNKQASRILKEIVLSRIANPESKRGSVLDLAGRFGVKLDLKAVYRMMDKIDDKQITKLNKLVCSQTESLFTEKIDVIYFDATTLYFESFTEDGLRKNGYSKDGKFNQPQVVLALMVTKSGLPIGYKTFSGNTFDGHTLIPTLKELKKHYDLDNVVCVADAGMFNRDNLKEIEMLHINGISYIVGARIKNMSKELKNRITDMNNYTVLNDDLKIASFDYKGKKLLISYSEKRALKDKYEREKGIAKLREKFKKDSSAKQFLSNNGYRKYLQLLPAGAQANCSFKLTINEDKIKADALWDGLKGILTNNMNLSDKELLSQYSSLWQIEESFRITKHDLKIRPIYHWKPRRVKAHLAIAFMAYTLVRHLEYRVRLQYIRLSPERIRQLLLSVQATILFDRKTKNRFVLPSAVACLDIKKIYRLMDVPLRRSVYRI